MDAINRNIHVLLSVIKRSEVYKEYKKQEMILDKDPELKARVDQFRARNFQMQNDSNTEDMFALAEQLSRASAELRKIPEVNAYLDAELALCKMMQKICRSLTEGIDIHVPDL